MPETVVDFCFGRYALEPPPRFVPGAEHPDVAETSSSALGQTPRSPVGSGRGSRLSCPGALARFPRRREASWGAA
jgi:hypothetical protein